MNGPVSLLLSFLLLSRYWALFVIVASSAIILPIPVNVVLIATGAFASQNYFSFVTCFGIALIANVLGDCFDYFFAHHFGRSILQTLRVSIPSYVQNIERYIYTHPGPTIILTRFGGVTDPPVNFLCGLSDISFAHFLFYDFIGNTLSTGMFLCVGYVLGIQWQNFTGLFDLFGWIVTGLIIATLLVIALWYKKNQKS